jgi:hypothetical protein
MTNYQTGYTHVANDLDYALRDALTPQMPPNPLLAAGQIFKVSYDLCFGQTPPTAANFTCVVQSASGPGGDINLGMNPLTCSITVP